MAEKGPICNPFFKKNRLFPRKKNFKKITKVSLTRMVRKGYTSDISAILGSGTDVIPVGASGYSAFYSLFSLGSTINLPKWIFIN